MKNLAQLYVLLLLLAFFPNSAWATPSFQEAMKALAAPIVEDLPTFCYEVRADGGTPVDITQPRVADSSASGSALASCPLGISSEILIQRTGCESWELAVRTPWARAEIRRNASETLLVVPDRLIEFSGTGELGSATLTLSPRGFLTRFLTKETSLQALPLLLPAADFGMLAQLPGLSEVLKPAGSDTWAIGNEILLRPFQASEAIGLEFVLKPEAKDFKGIRRLTLTVRTKPLQMAESPAGIHRQEISRVELEQVIFRGLRRMLSIKFPSPDFLVPPASTTVPHGILREHEGQTLLILDGTPEEMGEAHGRLLGPAIRRTVDSTMYLVGLVESVQKGKWFLHTLDEALARLRPHIPSDHLREMAAIASACPDLTPREIYYANVFPEYFHCSGFAVFGKATANGALYHGRVLDYMTEIGLQQAAVTMVCKPKGKFAYLNVGYAGLVGSVTGMNEKGISVGEMGGGGRGQWDGVPMTTLMRRALEECSTLDEVLKLWGDSPRTCEYYYVFADSKGPSAVAVKATPQALDVLKPGESHPLLGEGFQDAVVISAGSRLKLLRERVKEGWGTFTATSALHLMDRPVAMRSNLHNALMAPISQEVWVAHADDRKPAAERPYAHYDLKAILKESGE